MPGGEEVFWEAGGKALRLKAVLAQGGFTLEELVEMASDQDGLAKLVRLLQQRRRRLAPPKRRRGRTADAAVAGA